MTLLPDAATILIVDDQNTSSLEKLLAADGFQVLAADNGLAALNLLNSNPVDLVLLDIVMPGMDGYEVLRRIRSLPDGEKLPILMASARYTESGDAAHGLQLGADDYIFKPFEFVELRARISAKLRQRRLEQALRASRRAAEAQSELLRRTLGIVQHAAQSLDPDALVTSVLRGLRDELDVGRVAIWRLEQQPIPIPPDAPPFPEEALDGLRDGSAMVDEAGRALIPLRVANELTGALDLERPAGWNEATLTILQALADSLAILIQNTRYMRQIARENQFHELLNELSSEEQGALTDVISRLRHFMGSPLLLVDRWFNIIVGEPIPGLVAEGQMLDPLVAHYRREGVVETLARRHRPLRIAAHDEFPAHQIFPVALGGEVIALLITRSREGIESPDGEVERAARFLAGLLQRQREHSLREHTLRADFLSDFLSGRLSQELSRPAIFLRANALGLNLAQPAIVVQLELAGFDTMVDWTQPHFEQRVTELLGPLLRDVQRARGTLGLEGIEVALGHRVVGLLSFPATSDEREALDLVAQWVERVQEFFGQRSRPREALPAIGIGRYAADWEQIPRSAGEAERALRWVLRSADSHVAYYGDLGSERLLAAITDREEMMRFHNEQLAPVVAYDQQKDGELVRTLDVFFANGGHMARAAEVLAVHPNTLKYRLDQIAQLTGRDPRDPGVSLDLQLALKIHGMI